MGFFERDFLRERFSDLVQEKRELKQLYREESERIDTELYKIKNRLGELDKESKDYISENIDFENTLLKMTTIIDNLSKLIPSVPVEHVINKFNESFVNERKDIIIEEKIDREEILNLKEKEKIKSTGNVGKNYRDIGVVTNKVSILLKEIGRPIKLNEIEEKLNKEYGWKWTNFTATMNRIMKENKKVQRATKGYYQYNG